VADTESQVIPVTNRAARDSPPAVLAKSGEKDLKINMDIHPGKENNYLVEVFYSSFPTGQL
jgi:hypothetical protein